MEDQRPDAPELELTAQPADGEDALQLNPTDAPDAAVSLGDAFSIKVHKTESSPLRPAKAVTAEANDSVVAALMGWPIGMAKPAQPPAAMPVTVTPVAIEAAAKPAIASVIEPAVELPVPRPVHPVAITAQKTDNASDSLSRYTGGGLGRGPSDIESASAPAADPVPGPPPTYREREPESAPVKAVLPTAPLLTENAEAKPQPVSPPPRRAIPVAPVWPTAPTVTAMGAAPSPTKIAPTPTAIPTPPPRLYVPPATPVSRPAAPTPSPALTTATAPTAMKPAAMKPAATKPAAPFAPAIADESTEPAGPSGAWWTIPLTFVGIAIVACAMLIPAADENRRDNYELAKIDRDVDYFERQSDVNQDFLKRINTDATLAERLAMRQLHQTRQGVKIAPMSGKPDHFGASPYAMTRLDPPAPLPPYQPMPGRLTEWFLGGQQPQQMAALGLLVAGAGVCLGGLRKRV